MKKRAVSLISVIMVAILTVASSFAWLGRIFGDIDFTKGLIGSTETAYFAHGDGSKENPYVITNRTHMYNLAWLQYLGYFNMAASGNNGKAQSYFKVESDIDMEGLCLPPIGTVEYPFLCNFSGGGFVIANAKTTNVKSEYEYKPTNANFSGELLAKAVGGNGEVGNVSGLFGVVGDYDGALAKVNEAAVRIGVTPASQENINVSDFYLSGANIKSGSAGSLVGIIAGYVNAGVSNIGVYGCSLDVPNGGAIDDISANVSDYTMVGYCTDEYKTETSQFNVKISESGKKELALGDGSSGGAAGWGGSVDMEAMFQRVAYFAANKTNYVNNNFDVISDEYHLRYYGEKQGSLYVNKGYGSSGGGLYCVYGGGNPTVSYTKDYSNSNVFFVKSGNNYLTITSTSMYSSTGIVTDIDKAVTWQFSDMTNYKGYLYTLIFDVKYYLNINYSGTLKLQSVAESKWELNNNRIICSEYCSRGNNLCIENNIWKSANGEAATIEASTVGNQSMSRTFQYQATDSSGTITSWQTFLPLNVDDNYAVSDNNTGYIASGNNTATTNNPIQGDIRFRKDHISSIGSSLNNATSYDNSALEVLTRTSKSDGFVRISDDFNGANSSVSGKLSGYSKKTVSELGLQKYGDSDGGARKDMGDVLLGGGNNIYGMHFMNAPISTQNVYYAPYAKINGEDHYNYPMTANSIDFHLKTKGYINFFAGTYYGTEENFFSLHHIIKRSTTGIQTIKEISLIYGKGSGTYIYKYTDGTFSQGNSEPEGYEVVFDTSWITTPTIVYKAVYYFEIPVNAGEYALGSASTGDGAYLMYLDIGANAAEKGTRTVISERITVNEKISSVPKVGAAFVADVNGTLDDIKFNAAFTLQPSFVGTVGVSRTQSTVTISSGGGAANNVTGEYASIGTTLKNGGVTLSVDGVTSRVTVMDRLSLYDYAGNSLIVSWRTTTTVDSVVGDTVYAQFDGNGESTGADTDTIVTKFNELAVDSVPSVGTDTVIEYNYDSARNSAAVYKADFESDANNYYSVISYTVTVTYEDDSTALPEENFEVIKNVLPVTINGKLYA